MIAENTEDAEIGERVTAGETGNSILIARSA
jgi:hypothetical protein